MFQFTNTVIINSLIDSLSGKDKFHGYAAVAGPPAKPAHFDVAKVAKYVAFDATKAYLGGVMDVYKTLGYAPEKGQAKLTMLAAMIPTTGSAEYQLVIDLGLSQYSQNSFYSRFSPFKGKPLRYAFTVKAGDTTDDVCKAIEKVVKLISDRFGDYVTVKVSAADPVITIDCTDEYQLLRYVGIHKYDPIDTGCACNDYCECGWVEYQYAQGYDETGTPLDADNLIVKQGKPGFGTFEYITRNLLLPTMENTSYFGLNKDERPILDGIYDQYTIRYVRPRGIQGTDAVGDLVKSCTDHVFFVLQGAVSTAFATELAGVATATPARTIQFVPVP